MPRTSLHIDQDLLDNLDDFKTRYQDEFNIADEDARGRGNIVTALLRHAIRNLPSDLQKERDERDAPKEDAPPPVLTPYTPPPREIGKDKPALADIIDGMLSRKHITEIALDELLNIVLVDDNVTRATDMDLRRLASEAPSTLAKRFNVPIWTANRLALLFEFGKRLANSHSEKVKITNPTDAADYLMPKMRYLQKEILVVMCLDTKSQVTDHMQIAESPDSMGNLIGTSLIHEGTLNSSVFHPREILRYAIENSANAIMIAHNHPSGCPQPSQPDICATKQLIEACNQIGIKMLDHIIIGDGIYLSLKEEGHV